MARCRIGGIAQEAVARSAMQQKARPARFFVREFCVLISSMSPYGVLAY
jgi:hypothetical protein